MFATLAVLLLAARAGAADPDDIPVVGRPVELPFSEASAGFVRRGEEVVCPFRVESSVRPDRVEAEQPITLTVTVRALGEVRQPPVRIDLREMPAFMRSFFVEDITDGKREQSNDSTWRWRYRLKPRRAGIDEVPRVPFVFYNPDLRPAEKAFQTIWTDPLPITVTAPELPTPPDQFSDRVLTIATGPGIFADRSPWTGPGAALAAAVAGAPPLICALWYLAWRRLYPDAARRATLRRSRAATKALAALSRAARLAGRARAEATSRAVVAYLRERFDLPIAEPTPDESSEWLARHNPARADAARRLLAECAAGRFGPGENPADVVALAREFVTSAEEPTCPPSS